MSIANNIVIIEKYVLLKEDAFTLHHGLSISLGPGGCVKKDITYNPCTWRIANHPTPTWIPLLAYLFRTRILSWYFFRNFWCCFLAHLSLCNFCLAFNSLLSHTCPSSESSLWHLCYVHFHLLAFVHVVYSQEFLPLHIWVLFKYEGWIWIHFFFKCPIITLDFSYLFPLISSKTIYLYCWLMLVRVLSHKIQTS